jgi:hypothetical protein
MPARQRDRPVFKKGLLTMLRTNTSRFAATSLFALTASLSLSAQAQAPAAAPTVTFNIASGTTILKVLGLVQVTATANYPAGLRYLSLSGGYSGGTCFFPAGTTTGMSRLYFYCGYFPIGNYTFKATAVGADGQRTQQQIVLCVK